MSYLIDRLHDEFTSLREAKEYAYKQVNEKQRIIDDLKQALREALAQPAMKDPMLIEAMVRGVAEEGSVTGRIR